MSDPLAHATFSNANENSVVFTSPLSSLITSAGTLTENPVSEKLVLRNQLRRSTTQDWTDSDSSTSKAERVHQDKKARAFEWIPTLSFSDVSDIKESFDTNQELHLSKEIAYIFPTVPTSKFLTAADRQIIRFNESNSAYFFRPLFNGLMTDIEYSRLMFTAFIVDIDNPISVSYSQVLGLDNEVLPRLVRRKYRMRASNATLRVCCTCAHILHYR